MTATVPTTQDAESVSAGPGDDGGDAARTGGIRQGVGVAALHVVRQLPAAAAESEEEPDRQQQHHAEQHGDRRGLPGQQGRRPLDESVAHPGRPGAVQPVPDALGDAAGHHAAQGAGQHRDGGGAQPLQRRAPDGQFTVERDAEDAQRGHQHALPDGEHPEGLVPRQLSPGRDPFGPRPDRVDHRQQQDGDGDARQRPHRQLVDGVVGFALLAASTAHHVQHPHRAGDDQHLDDPAEGVEPGAAAGLAVVARRGGGQRGGDGEESGGGVRGAQPGHQPLAEPESGPAQRRALLRLRVALVHLAAQGPLRLVRRPGAVREPPQQHRQDGGHHGGQRQAAPRLAPPAASARRILRHEAEPGTLRGARARSRALPRDQVESDLAGGGDEQHGEAERDEPDENTVQTHGS